LIDIDFHVADDWLSLIADFSAFAMIRRFSCAYAAFREERAEYNTAQ